MLPRRTLHGTAHPLSDGRWKKRAPAVLRLAVLRARSQEARSPVVAVEPQLRRAARVAEARKLAVAEMAAVRKSMPAA